MIAVFVVYRQGSFSRPSLRRGVQSGFSLLEMIITIALIGILTGVAINMMGSDTLGKTRDAKLTADVARLNQLVAVYIGDGGDLSTVTSEQAALDKMKRVRPRAEQNTNLGVSSGRLIDVRMRALSGTSSSPTGRTYRARWNTSSRRFQLVTSGSGADEFYLDEALTDASFPLDSRTTSKKQFNNLNGWIWGGNAADASLNNVAATTTTVNTQSNGFTPGTDVPSGTGSGSGTGTGTGTGTGSGSGSGTGTGVTPPSALPTPIIAPTGGTFAYAAFPSAVTISNGGATGGSSTLYYRLNAGSWLPYSGALTIASGDRVEGLNVATAPAYSDSAVAAQEFYRLVSDFSGSGSGTWNTVNGGSTLKYSISPGDPTTTLSHGDTKLDLGNGQFLDAGAANTLTYTKNNFSTISPNTAFKLGEVDMLNGTTFNDSEAAGATLSVNLIFTNPPLTKVADIRFNFISTANSSDRLASADIVEIANPDPVSITQDGVDYTLHLQWVTLDPGAGVVQGNQFLVFEAASARAELRATLVPNH